MNYKVKLVAVAKDESAYLADWVQHHLYYGFSEIDIYINRTSDDSVTLLENIKKKCRQVNYFIADWIDQLPPPSRKNLQHICYMQALKNLDKDITHVLFLDIDEYWVSKKYITINQYLEACDKKQDLTVFEWFNEGAVSEAFLAIPKTLSGKYHPLGKSMIRVSSINKIKQIRLHVPSLHENSTILLADGTVFKPQPNLPQHVANNLNSLKHTFIFHRMFRSETEYLASLYRGNPEEDFPIKLNRNGYGYSDTDKLDSHEFKTQDYERYIQSKNSFMEFCELNELIQNSHELILNNSNKLKFVLAELLLKRPNEVTRVLKNIKDTDIIDLFSGAEKKETSNPVSFKSRVLNRIKKI